MGPSFHKSTLHFFFPSLIFPLLLRSSYLYHEEGKVLFYLARSENAFLTLFYYQSLLNSNTLMQAIFSEYSMAVKEKVLFASLLAL